MNERKKRMTREKKKKKKRNPKNEEEERNTHTKRQTIYTWVLIDRTEEEEKTITTNHCFIITLP